MLKEHSTVAHEALGDIYPNHGSGSDMFTKNNLNLYSRILLSAMQVLLFTSLQIIAASILLSTKGYRAVAAFFIESKFLYHRPTLIKCVIYFLKHTFLGGGTRIKQKSSHLPGRHCVKHTF